MTRSSVDGLADDSIWYLGAHCRSDTMIHDTTTWATASPSPEATDRCEAGVGRVVFCYFCRRFPFIQTTHTRDTPKEWMRRGGWSKQRHNAWRIGKDACLQLPRCIVYVHTTSIRYIDYVRSTQSTDIPSYSCWAPSYKSEDRRVHVDEYTLYTKSIIMII